MSEKEERLEIIKKIDFYDMTKESQNKMMHFIGEILSEHEKWIRQALDNNEVNTHDIGDILDKIKILEKKVERLDRHYNLVTTFNDRIRHHRRRLNVIDKEIDKLSGEKQLNLNELEKVSEFFYDCGYKGGEQPYEFKTFWNEYKEKRLKK